MPNLDECPIETGPEQKTSWFNSPRVAVAIALVSFVCTIGSCVAAGLQYRVAQEALDDQRQAQAPHLDFDDVQMNWGSVQGVKTTILSLRILNTGGGPALRTTYGLGCGQTPEEAAKINFFKSVLATLPANRTTYSPYCTVPFSKIFADTNRPVFLRVVASYEDEDGKRYDFHECRAISFAWIGDAKDQNLAPGLQHSECGAWSCDALKCRQIPPIEGKWVQ